MTREESITILKTFMENPLFSEVHKAAFNIAIHDIKQRHDWDINNLILINKDNYEPQEPFIDKPCVSEKVCEHDKQMVLDKIRAEIEEHAKINQNLNVDRARTLCWCLDVIDKYKAESAHDVAQDIVKNNGIVDL